MRVRASFDKEPDLTPLLDEIHKIVGEELYAAAVESTPVDRGVTKLAWHKTRTDKNITTISNSSYVGPYQVLSLLHEGTRPHKVGGFQWHAAGGVRIVPGLRVHIDPERIAVRAVESPEGLPEDVPKGTKRKYWKAVQFYSYRKNLTDAINIHMNLAIRKLNSENK
jgi:hypothetical protein